MVFSVLTHRHSSSRLNRFRRAKTPRSQDRPESEIPQGTDGRRASRVLFLCPWPGSARESNSKCECCGSRPHELGRAFVVVPRSRASLAGTISLRDENQPKSACRPCNKG